MITKTISIRKDGGKEMEQKVHKHKFKAEVKQLLDILAHSLYTHREIFLRELISNASDALEKVHYEQLRGTAVLDKDAPLEITLKFDKDHNVLTVSDTGIGMSEKEIAENIGTIAKSGTAEFLKHAAENPKESTNIIGKFGVGFYSVFMVAEEVTITTRSFRKQDKPVRWRSQGLGTYELEVLKENIERGTTIEIKIKEDAKEFLEKWKIEEVVKKHSNFVPFPIKVEKEQINTVRALWREPKFQLKEKDYHEFYKFLTFDSDPPLDTLHISVDAPVQFNSLVFFPAKNYEKFMVRQNDHGLDLYVNRVLIMHENKDLLPEYLRFLRGVVDSEDVPLNISRETLQENLVISKISSTLVHQILAHLASLAEKSPDKYRTFWQEFSSQFKMGYTDFANHEKFAELLRFNSSKMEKDDDLTSLQAYKEGIKEGQKEIYYVFTPNRAAMKSNPHLEIFKKKGIEVLYLYEPIDEFVMDSLRSYKDLSLKSVEQVDPTQLESLTDIREEKKADVLDKEDEKVFDKLLRRMKDILGDKVEKVVASKRLTNSPSCLVSPDGTMSSGMQKIMQIINKDASIPKKVMEINKDHPLIRQLLEIYKKDVNDAHLSRVTEQLFDSSLLLEGYLTDAHEMVARIEQLLEKSTELYIKG
jgi:molecular chaperone HtpG